MLVLKHLTRANGTPLEKALESRDCRGACPDAAAQTHDVELEETLAAGSTTEH